MKQKLILLCGALLVALTIALSACAGPSISHQVAGREDCLSCHASDGTQPYPTFHAKEGFTNDDCSKCHQLATSTNK